MSAVENPFAGLRPYDLEESYLFFGRERATDELLLRLGRDNFIAVLGPSGSGKSSVVRAGLIPALEGGQLRRAGAAWRTAILRPGGDPFQHLADALAREKLFGDELDVDQGRAMILSRLRRGSRGLSDLVNTSALGPRENLLVLVDQFEELFRFASSQRDNGVRDDAAAFVQLLLDAADRPTPRLYVALTMRSDFLGDCARFRGLAEALSRHLYLVPRMTRAERRAAITGPVAIAGAEVEPRLVSRLLNEAGDSDDSLPVLQHALQRTWECGRAALAQGDPVDSPHYEAAGQLRGAIDLHAQEALDELDPDQQALLRRVFQTITELGADRRGVRRPTRLGQIAEILAVDPDELIAVLEPFRQEGRAFLMPRVSEAETLDTDTVIDISHEALMRGWGTLKTWVREEADSVDTFRRLAQTAGQFPDDPEWRYLDPALTAAMHWRDRAAPTAAWAEQYEDNFEEAMSFLDKSMAFRDAAILQEKAERRRRLEAAEQLAAAEQEAAAALRRTGRRTGYFLVVALILLALSAFGFLSAQLAKGEARREAAVARDAEQQANDAAKKARAAEAEARLSAEAALAAQARADAEKTAADEARRLAEERALAEAAAKEAAAEAAELAEAAAEHAKNEAHRADGEADKARAAAAEAERLQILAELARARAEVQRARVVLRQPVESRPAVLASALKAASAVEGQPEDAELTALLGDLLREFGGAELGLAGRSRAVGFSPVGTRALFAADGSGGHLVGPGEVGSGVILAGLSAPVRVVSWDGGGRLAALGDEAGTVQVWSGADGATVAQWSVPTALRTAALSPDGTELITGGEGGDLRLWALPDGSQVASLKGHDRDVHHAEFRPDGSLLATAADDGRVCLWSGDTYGARRCFDDHTSWVRDLAFSADGGTIASAGDDGSIRVLDRWPADLGEGDARHLSLDGHQGPVTSVSWSPDGQQLLSSSFDGTVRLWARQGDGWSDEPRRFTGHPDWVWSAVGMWTPSGLEFVFTAGEDGTVRVFDGAGAVVQEFAGDGTGVRTLSASADGRWVVWSVGATARVLDVDAALRGGLPRDLGGLLDVACGWLSPSRTRADFAPLWVELQEGSVCGD